MQYKLFFESLTNIFPLDSALADDKVGLQINVKKDTINKVLVAYELNNEVVAEAVGLAADLIIVFHPLIYRPLQEIDYDERVSDLCAKLIKNDISLFSVHTCFDNHKLGTNTILADKFSLNDRNWIVPDKKYSSNGFGVYGKLPEKMEIDTFIKQCEEIFMSPIRYNSKVKKSHIETIAIIGGSGSSYLTEVEKLDVDAFVSADISYHNFHRVEGKLLLVDVGHYEMEQFVAKAIYNLLKNEIQKVEFHYSKIYTNPVRYTNKVYTELQIKNLVN